MISFCKIPIEECVSTEQFDLIKVQVAWTNSKLECEREVAGNEDLYYPSIGSISPHLITRSEALEIKIKNTDHRQNLYSLFCTPYSQNNFSEGRGGNMRKFQPFK